MASRRAAAHRRRLRRVTRRRSGIDTFLRVWRRDRRHALRRGALALALAIVIIAPALTAWSLSRSLPRPGEPTPDPMIIGDVNFALDELIRGAHRVFPLVLDRYDQVVGVPASLINPEIFNARGYATSRIVELPEHWWRLLLAIEDGNRGRWFHVLGVDLKALFRAALKRDGSGGSTVEMQLVKTVKMDTDRRTVIRKIRDILHAAVLNRYFAGQDAGELATWYATHVPFIKGNFHGLEVAAWTLFNKPAAELSLAQQALFAAAVRHRIHRSRRQPTAWARVKRRAAGALHAVAARGCPDAPDRRCFTADALTRALAELEAMRYPSMEQRNLPQCLVERWQYMASDRFSDPSGRAMALSHGELVQAIQEVRERYADDQGQVPWHDIARVHLTTGAAENCAVKEEVEAAKKRLADHRNIEDSYLTAALADAEGRIRYFYANGKAPLYHGVPRAESGRYDLRRETRTIASIGKVVAAILFAREGDRPWTRYRERPRARSDGSPFRNAGGDTGNRSKRVTAQAAFARSNNLAIMSRLDEVERTAAQLDDYLRLWGFGRCEPQLETDPRAHLTSAIALGTICGSPRTYHRLIQSVAVALLGNPVDRDVCSPHIVERVLIRRQRSFSTDTSVAARWPTCTRLAGRMFRGATRTGPRFIRSVLGGVVEDGTASASLGTYAASKHDAVRWHIAKTGSVNVGRTQETKEANLVGALSVQGGVFSYALQMGPSGDARALARRFGGGTAAVLIRPMLAALVERRGGLQ